MIHSYQIYVGNSAVYDDDENTYCGTINDVPKEQSKGGGELFCNREGRYIHIVNKNDPVLLGDDWLAKICSVGIFGTLYEHQDQVAESLSLSRIATKT